MPTDQVVATQRYLVKLADAMPPETATDLLDNWRAWARDELFQPEPNPCAALILVLIDELRNLREEK
jgi:hypothetical protein